MKIKKSIREVDSYHLPPVKYTIKLDQNENPHEPPEALKKELYELIASRPWSRYPPLETRELREALSRYTGVDPDGIVVGNGSNEIIQAIFMAVVSPGSKIVIPLPTFYIYHLIGKMMESEVIEVPLREDYTYDAKSFRDACISKGADIVIIVNPNNPTGCLFDRELIIEILEQTDGLIVIDEAYFEFSGETVADMIEHYSNLIVLRTFSKAFSMAGLRMGYALMAPEIAYEIDKVTLPYNLNFFTYAAALKTINYIETFREGINEIISERDRLYENMSSLDGVTVYPSKANFLLFETKIAPREIFEELLDRGILIRNVSSYPMLSKALRVSVGLVEENNRFLEALTEVMAIT